MDNFETKVEEFSILTADGLSEIHGELMFPGNEAEKLGAVLIVPGGWFMERDGFMGDSYTEADLMYRRIALRLLAEGFVVARYDNRGVSGNEFTIGLTKNSSDPIEDSRRYLESCVDFDIRRSVTPETLASDAEVVFQYLCRNSGIVPSDIAVFAHSEGARHVARLIESGVVNPKGVIFAGSISWSPKAICRWQMIDRYVETVMGWDLDGNGRVSSSDVARAYEGSFFGEVGVSEDQLLPENEYWERSDLEVFFTSRYEQEKRATQEVPDGAAYPHLEKGDSGFVAASNRWWKQWFDDDRSTMELLVHYQGHVTFHFCGLDSQLPLEASVEAVNTGGENMANRPKVIVHPKRGHGFRTATPMHGPMDQEAEKILVGSITEILHAE